ncbi:MAG: magnesium transporter MgtE N-terminal domain-containing protein [Acidimicrobiia bacterium]
MDAPFVYVSRLVKLPIRAADGSPIGRIVDVVVGPAPGGRAPEVVGYVGSVQRRRIFVNAARTAGLGPSGIELLSGTIDLRHFEQRTTELLAVGDLFDQRVDGDVVHDIALRPTTTRAGSWSVAAVALRPPRTLRRRARIHVVPWADALSLFDFGPMGAQIGAMRGLHPADIATELRALPVERRRQLASYLDDERLAELLEEMDEDEQLGLIAELDITRLADVLAEMDADDAADLLGEMSGPMRVQVLRAMDPEDAAPVQRVLIYDTNTAGGLMNPEPLVVTPGTTVSEALAMMRDPDEPAALAAQVFVCEPPTDTPTGRYLGAIGFQRLLREPPGMPVEKCIENTTLPVLPDTPESAVAEQLAKYDLFALPVCDEHGRLLGVVTVDDMLDHALRPDWKRGR